MASIYGLNLRNITRYEKDKESFYSGDLYLDDMKLCSWNQNEDDKLNDTFDFVPELHINKTKLTNLVGELCRKVIIDEKSYPIDLEVLMCWILWLRDRELFFTAYNKLVPGSALICGYMNDMKEVHAMVKPDTSTETALAIIDEMYMKDNIFGACDGFTLLWFKKLEDFDYGESIKLQAIQGEEDTEDKEYENISRMIEECRPEFEEFAKQFGKQINEMIGYSDEVNICINFTWMLGYLTGKQCGREELFHTFMEEWEKFKNKYTKKDGK